MKTKKPLLANAYGYTRVSSDRQADSGLGLAAQLKTVRAYAAGNLRGVAKLEGVFTDRAVSAASKSLRHRPQGAKLMAALKRGDHLIIAKMDRAFRNLHDFARTMEQWDKQGVRVHILDINVDTSSPVGRLLASIIAAIAEWESKRIGERIREAKAVVKSRGQTTNGMRRLGYTLKGKRLVPHSGERKIMAKVANLRRQKLYWREIGERLKADGVKPLDRKQWNPQRCWRLYRAAMLLAKKGEPAKGKARPRKFHRISA